MKISKKSLYTIIFESDTWKGKLFDLSLIFIILLSILFIILESVEPINSRYHAELKIAEWVITALFTLEYGLRLWILDKPWKYVLSFYGVIDLLSILPSYLVLFFAGGQSLMVIRALRLLRIFRIMKLSRYTTAARILAKAMWASREKILVFLFFVATIVIIFGTIMYLVEGPENGFTSIPAGIYWAVVTLTTVGYGDISPVTPLGQFLASLIMVMGYAIIAVPTGIVTAEMMRIPVSRNTQVCHYCMFDRHDDDARFCKKCGTVLKDE